MSVAYLITGGLGDYDSGSTPSPTPVADGDVPFGLDGPVVSVSSLPAVIGVDESGSITPRVGSTARVRITCNQTVTSLSLAFTVETLSKVDVASVATGSITKEGEYAFLYLTSDMTASERTLRWSLVNTANGDAVAGGLMFVSYDAQGDA